MHRYPDRVLLKLTHVCPVYCRFCFRREVVGPGGPQALSDDAISTAVAYIATRPQIWEVILTGGDPFMLSPRRIADVTARLSAISHVKVLRWHTRVPVAEPGRVTPELVSALTTSKATVYVAVHVNHAARADATQARAACARIIDAGIPHAEPDRPAQRRQRQRRSLARSHARLRRGAHQALLPAPPRPCAGHQRASACRIAEGQAIMRQLRGRISGLAQPTYVLDIPGGHGKVPVGPGYIEEGGSVIDPAGSPHSYP